MSISESYTQLTFSFSPYSTNRVITGRRAEDIWINHYRFSRHPSYTGFFYWAVATQVLLGNVISVAGFVYVLAKFFEARIIGECPVTPLVFLRSQLGLGS